MIELKQDERLDDLERNGYKIIQNPNKFCFGMDAVLLSGFAHVRKGENVLDMGTGTGIIPILMEETDKIMIQNQPYFLQLYTIPECYPISLRSYNWIFS